jgi:hypothetical protein
LEEQVAATGQGMVRKFACCEEILKEKKKPSFA